MKDYEAYSDFKIPKGSAVILRVDGRSFHTLATKIDLAKPYDENFAKLMSDVCEDLLKEFSPSFIYTFSDEINILLDEIPFNRRLEKINSVIASFTSSSFTINYNKHFKKKLYKPIAFDCRVVLIAKEDVSSYFKWRQDEAWRNCVNSYGVEFLKSKYPSDEANKRISGLKMNDIHEMLFKHGINLNDVDNWHKRGIGLYKMNNKIYRDFNLPLFSDKFFEVWFSCLLFQKFSAVRIIALI